MDVGQPVIPFELRQRLEIHHLQVRVCQLEYANAELRMQVADKMAAMESDRLTRDREDLAALINTPQWRYNFDTREFLHKPPPPPLEGRPVVNIEAMWLDNRLTFDIDPVAVPAESAVKVRLRYRADDPAAKDMATTHINRVYGHVPREISFVPVTDLKRDG